MDFDVAFLFDSVILSQETGLGHIYGSALVDLGN